MNLTKNQHIKKKVFLKIYEGKYGKNGLVKIMELVHVFAVE